MATRVHAEELEAVVGDAKFVAFSRVSGTARFSNEESPVEHPAAFNEAQQDYGINQRRDPNPCERAVRVGAEELIGE